MDLSAAVRKTSAEMEEWHSLSEKEPWCSWDFTTSSITTRVTHALRMVLWLVNIFNPVHCWCSPLGRITLKSHWPVTYETRSPWASLLWRRGDLKAGDTTYVIGQSMVGNGGQFRVLWMLFLKTCLTWFNFNLSHKPVRYIRIKYKSENN